MMTADPLAYAGIVSRSIAFAIDVAIAAVVSTAGALLVRVSGQALGFDVRGGGVVAAVYLTSLPLVFATYCVLFWSLSGRTPGMALLGLRVVSAGGSPPRLGRSIVRFAAYALSAVLMIGFVWIMVDRRRQGFHDKLAATFVVYDERALGNGRADPRDAVPRAVEPPHGLLRAGARTS